MGGRVGVVRWGEWDGQRQGPWSRKGVEMKACVARGGEGGVRME